MDIVKQIAGLKTKLNENKIESTEDPGLKEVVRRLRIQNKKLLEQVAGLRASLVQVKSEKDDVQQQYLELNGALSELREVKIKPLTHEKDIFPLAINSLCSPDIHGLQKN